MTRRDWINIALFVTTACMVVLASQGSLGSPDVLSRTAFGIGIGMIGGVICGTTLYGINALKVEPPVRYGAFGGINRNQGMGQGYWIKFINDLDRVPQQAWFIGKSQHVWIDPGLAYRAELKARFIQRVSRAMKDPDNTGWNIYVIVADKDAADKWRQFVGEVEELTNYRSKCPHLIRIGVVRSPLHYSVVAYSKGMVIIPYTSTGRSADSPTFEVRPENTVAELYRDDLVVIKNTVPPSDWVL
jgi:hypothetical protein